MPASTVFISAAPGDEEVASALHRLLRDLEVDVWVRKFDLSAGETVVDAVSYAISESSWFVLIVSQHSTKSHWVTYEANAATCESLYANHNIIPIVFRVDATPLPANAQRAFASAFTVDLASHKSLDDACLEIAEYIDKTVPAWLNTNVYVDRGEDADKFSLIARPNRVIFLLGWAGIGKSEFVLNRVKEQLRKRALNIKLKRGYSLDMLSRDVIQKCHFPQPPSSCGKLELLGQAVSALRARSEKFFLFLNRAEAALDPTNQPQEYLSSFLRMFIDENINTHIVLTTTRNVDFDPAIAAKTDLQRLFPLRDEYIRECLERWLEGHDASSHPEMDKYVKFCDGIPLAAKLVASRLKANPAALLPSERQEAMRLRLAEYIIDSLNDQELDDTDKSILKILAVVREPLQLSDLSQLRTLSSVGLEALHGSWARLSELFLVQQDGEELYLHSFIDAYWRAGLARKELLSIARDVAEYAYAKTMRANEELGLAVMADEDYGERVAPLSNAVLRYAVIASKMLGYIGDEERLKQLPLQLHGNVRELVFFFYQDQPDYQRALWYASEWLRISPADSEILLYKARCYRRFGDRQSLEKAERIVEQLERDHTGKKFLIPRLRREMGFIQQKRGNIPEAKQCFSDGIRMYVPHSYPGNHVGLATLLLHEADEVPEYMSEYQKELAKEALSLLSTARRLSSEYERYSLEAYIEALILAGEEETALPLLRKTLEDRPNDPRWNYRMAEVMRKSGRHARAETYSRKALKGGFERAALTLANVLYQQWAVGGGTDEKLKEAANVAEGFRTQTSREQEVKVTVLAKIYRALGRWDKAEDALRPYGESEDPYIVYEKCQQLLHKYQQEVARGDIHKAKTYNEDAKERLNRLSRKRRLTEPLQEMLIKLNGSDL